MFVIPDIGFVMQLIYQPLFFRGIKVAIMIGYTFVLVFHHGFHGLRFVTIILLYMFD